MSRAFLRTVLACSVVACTADLGTSSSNLPPLGHHGAGASDGGALDDGGAASGAGDATVGATSIETACGDFALARCKRDDECTGGVHDLATYGSQTTCVARRTALCIVTSSAAGTVETPASIEACAASIPAQSCADAFDFVPTSACTPPPGSLTTGAACIADSQCASTYCAIGPDAVCGSCASAPKAGDHCASSAECGNRGGLACASGVCLPVGRVNAGCGPSIPCGFGLSCVGATATVPGTCQVAPADAGASCDPAGASAPACDAMLGLTCDPVAKHCVAVPFVAAGQPCGDLATGLTECAAGTCAISAGDAGAPADAGAHDAAIDASDAATGDAGDAGDAASDAAVSDAGATPPPPERGTCLAAATEGAACDMVRGPSCLAPSRCVPSADGGTAGTCTFPSGTTCH